jgi:carboxyvinyl-carboxyphosphonate phosphorylmutase
MVSTNINYDTIVGGGMARDGTALDRILAGSTCTMPASVFDPLTARMAVELGYRCAVLPGSSVSLHHLGVPDITLVSHDVVVDLCRRIARGLPIPLIVDGDHGFGNAINARRFAEDLAASGAAAVTIEDTYLPRRLSPQAEAGISREEACAKIRAAVDGAAGSSLQVIARTSTAVCPDKSALVDRLRAFEQTGAAALFVSGMKDWATLEAVVAATTLPLVLGARSKELEDQARLGEMGVRIALACHSVSLSAYRGAWDRLSMNAAPRPAEDFSALVDRLSGGPDFRAQAQAYCADPLTRQAAKK